jgi:predicted transposase YbfD/YdcC
MARWAEQHTTELLAELPHMRPDMPGRSTLGRALRGLDIEALEGQISAYARTVDDSDEIPGRIEGPDGSCYRGQALDGKAVRGAQAHGQPVHLVSLVRHESGTVLGQARVADKRNEITAAPALLAGRDLTGTVTTVDALLTQRSLTRQIVDQGGDYLMVVKANQRQLYEDLTTLFAAPPWPPGEEDRQSYCTVEYGHGRRERRTVLTSTALAGYLDWPGAQQVAQRTCERWEAGVYHAKVNYAVTSLSRERGGPQQIAALWRGHWTIENAVHHVRDETLREDRGQAHTGHTAQALAALRNALLTALRDWGWSNIAEAVRHYSTSVQETLHFLGASAQ